MLDFILVAQLLSLSKYTRATDIKLLANHMAATQLIYTIRHGQVDPLKFKLSVKKVI